jgi:hypothetical protein
MLLRKKYKNKLIKNKNIMEYTTKTTITEIKHGELVDMFSLMLYGNCNFIVDNTDFRKEYIGRDDDCIEWKMASILLNGGEVLIGDTNSEGEEHYGKLRYLVKDGIVYYRVTLQDIKDGLARCADDKNPHIRAAAISIMEDDGEADGWDGDNILQTILYGEVVYG